jgi:hypothetical protein
MLVLQWSLLRMMLLSPCCFLLLRPPFPLLILLDRMLLLMLQHFLASWVILLGRDPGQGVNEKFLRSRQLPYKVRPG